MPTPTEVAQAQLDAYNAQDLDAHVAYFADDVKVADLNGAVTIDGASSLSSCILSLIDFACVQAK